MGGTTTRDPTPPPPGDEKPVCPSQVTATLPNPGGISKGEKLAMILEGVEQPVLVLTTVNGARLGAVAGVPALSQLIQCLKDQVPYEAHVDFVHTASLTCLIVRPRG